MRSLYRAELSANFQSTPIKQFELQHKSKRQCHQCNNNNTEARESIVIFGYSLLSDIRFMKQKLITPNSSVFPRGL